MARPIWLFLMLCLCACGPSTRGDRRAFLIAAENGDDHLVREQLEAGIAPDDVFQIGDRTALCLAAINGHPEVVQMLLEKGADPTFEHFGASLKMEVQAMRGHVRDAHADPASTATYKKQDGTSVPLKTMTLNEPAYDMVLKLLEDASAPWKKK